MNLNKNEHFSKVSFRNRLKKVFSSDIGVEPSLQVLGILQYACGLNFDLVLISTENPNFEMVSNYSFPDLRIMMMSQMAKMVAMT